MKRIHPNVRCAITLVALAVLMGVIGCRNQSGAAMNPFLAPSRVPPPATRALQPGEARPYYPGDPLPVMQSGAAPRADVTAGNWVSPSATAPLPTKSSAQGGLAFSNESKVTIPADGDSLRFALPARVDPEPAPIAQAAAAPAAQTVFPASYTDYEPANSPAAEPATANPWRSPQISPSTTAAQAGHSFWPSPAQLPGAPNTMDARLRAVASPPPEPGQFAMPRIRLPAYVAAPLTSNDGFRPRSRMR